MPKADILMTGVYPDWDMTALEENYVVHRLWEAEDRQALLKAVGKDIRAIATKGELGASAELMAALPNLEIVSCYGVGTDAIDLSYARDRGIRVTNTPDVLTDDVADIAIGLLLAAARRIAQADVFVRAGDWRNGAMPLVTRVSGKKLGLVGMGRIGQAIARRGAAFGCDIAYFSRNQRPDVAFAFEPDLIALAKWADFLVVIVPGGEATRNLVDGAVLAALGAQGILVNVSRGSTVDEAALIAALQEKTIQAAGLDVFWNEPNIDARFMTLDNIVLHPHHGSGTVETRQAMGQLVRDNLAAHFSGATLLTPVV
ncbi:MULTISPECIES: 2-hydroxyacid dehydrogenase [Rhizobium]|uniref:2-hydroxyacid dehydrogenase n=1 Tax=Rhizobium rhododendri TaxID=2506430 RepID=A0ABY8IR25_9HYPH|nr:MULTISPECIES: 2-hydroxyacid dehydrogenase [Rhizobium]MBO9134714.1 2-hydroxyacid dehydrogenase [Rhizobium sp. B209b/85]QXZ81335.1 2-hydroxyacid dehydrogenase [Rhizobium sp. L51/94]QXZ98335.1 2-hydroxyacid dehydrogenase [Rhizobium sp. B230/85]TQX85767.1 2-hydroxyacid dehydrogenase [Rhizobium sp. rho-13.1]TQY10520.1 2-hydroxyacid dehydrogenase [Rhizobium sp. rho-1.1]